MGADWVKYTVRAGDDTLEKILVRFGHFPARTGGFDPAADHTPEVILETTWTSPQNPKLHEAGRTAYNVITGEQIFLPPRNCPANMRPRQYTANGTEGSLTKVIDWIKSQHGASSLEPCAVTDAQLTPDYLYNLFENVPFAENHPGGAASGAIAPQAGEVITFFITLRPTANRDAAAGPQGGASSNSMVSGPAPFTITVALAMDTPAMSLLNVDHSDPNVPTVTGSFRTTKAKFSVTVTKTGTADPYRTTFRIFDGDGKLYYEEIHTDGDWIQPGTRNWEWDGFNSADDTKASMNTRVLRNKMTLQVVVEPMQGVSAIHEYYLNNRAPKGEWADLIISLADKHIEAEMFVKFERITDDPAVMGLAAFGLLAAGAAATGILMLAEFGILSAVAGSQHMPDAKKDRIKKIMWGATGGAVALAELVTVIVELNKIHLSDEEFDKAVSLLKAGIKRFWSRTGDRAITVGGSKFEFRASCTHRSDDAVKFALMKPLFAGQRGVNLGMVLPGCPVIVTYEPDHVGTRNGGGELYDDHCQEIGAHELGHTVLADDVDKAFSIRHKGTTGGATDQKANDSAKSYADVAPPAELDLMVYYKWEAHPAQYYERIVAAEADVLRVFNTTQIEWREDKDHSANDFSGTANASPDKHADASPAPSNPSGGAPGPSASPPPSAPA